MERNLILILLSNLNCLQMLENPNYKELYFPKEYKELLQEKR